MTIPKSVEIMYLSYTTTLTLLFRLFTIFRYYWK